ncbi:MAG: hypothetical protein EOP06_17495 [Proteobacteria bacterium]|nr:MAG: hypothetical protein EOP06_17495 [Pseudomonadota bacterium]
MKTKNLVLTLLTASVSAGTAYAEQPKTYMKKSQVPAYKLVQKNKQEIKATLICYLVTNDYTSPFTCLGRLHYMRCGLRLASSTGF